jgi:hypothetical protein
MESQIGYVQDHRDAARPYGIQEACKEMLCKIRRHRWWGFEQDLIEVNIRLVRP